MFAVILKRYSMWKNNLLLFAAALICSAVTAQNEDWRLYAPDGKQTVIGTASSQKDGNIRFVQDSRIALMDSLKKANPTPMDGFRVQIFFGSRNEANKARADFLRINPEVGAYVTYLAPNFRLRVGDFRTRTEAEKFKREILQVYPGSYIVADQIALPHLGKGKL